jgi:glycosyltransferase involved in cell wall biosynthesis
VIQILHVVSSLGRGGAERVLADLVAATDKDRFRHIVAHLHGPDDLAGEIRAAGAEVVCLDAPLRHGWIGGSRALRRVIAERRPDLVHSTTFEANIAARLAAGRALPLITWLVSMEYDPESVRAAGWSSASNLYRRLIDGVTARASRTRFVACSGAVARMAVERLKAPAADVETIYNPVRLEAVRAAPGEAEAARVQLGIPPGAFVCLSVGRMDPPKAHDLLLRAFAAAARPDSWLVLLGKGPRREALERLAAELGVAERVRFVDSVPSVAPYLALADLFVFPSRLEGLPVALLEAMCAGLPCLASDIPPHAEVVEEGVTGRLFPRDDGAALQAAMERLQGDPAERARLGAAARAYGESRFAIGTIVDQWQALFERLVSS